MIAPWWPEAYYNLGIALESTNKYDDAIKALKLYLTTGPKEGDARETQDRIYAIEAARKLARAEVSEAKKEEEAKPDFSGVWGMPGFCWRYKFIIKGRELTITGECVGAYTRFLYGTGTVEDRNFEGTAPGIEFGDTGRIPPHRFKGSLSDDNKTIQFSKQNWPTETWTRVSK